MATFVGSKTVNQRKKKEDNNHLTMSAVKPTSLPTTPVAILDRALYGSGINTVSIQLSIVQLKEDADQFE